MSRITTHVLDTAHGWPAVGIAIRLERRTGDSWELLGNGRTDRDGRLRDLLSPNTPLQRGVYRLSFDTGVYFSVAGLKPFFPCVTIDFTVEDVSQHYHVPLLLSPFGYSTYRGS